MKNKFVIVLRSGIENWVALNTTAHLCAKLGSVVGSEIAGKQPIDKSGFKHSGIPQYANAVCQAKNSDQIREVMRRAKEKGLIVIDYPRAGLDTYTDDEFCEAVEKDDHERMEYYGCCIYGDTEVVKKVTGDLKLWK
ncbi:MAG: DUF2000 domain-containing protein [Candidatus Dojkabacteria bacterium]|jgi:hypothetical protein|nr:DUF2000 domain-containing protein [Candidatus Dojkabacteria bacterium]